MPKFSKGHNSRKIRWIVFLINQVIYTSSPISWPSFKPLAQIVSRHNSRKGDNLYKKKYGSAIFPWGIHIWNFKTLACTVHKIWHASDFILISSKGHNSRKGDNSDKKKTCISYFSMRNPHMKFQNPSMHVSWQTDRRTTRNQYAPSTSSELGA